MKRNVGVFDRIIRMTLGALAVFYLLTGGFAFASSLALGVIAFILFATGIFGMCPLYSLLGISTDNQE